MLSNADYVTLSLELHLFFARIMKEHAIFLEAGFTPKNANLAKEADKYKLTFETLLSRAVDLSNGMIRPAVLNSGEIITNFTLGTEQKTQYFTGIPINQTITIRESQLYSNLNPIITPTMLSNVQKLNQNVIVSLDEFINFKRKILDGVLSCNIFTTNYPHFIEHIIREAETYHDLVIRLEAKENIEIIPLEDTELFWDNIMMEHALFIRGTLDPTEKQLVIEANDFAEKYDVLIRRLQTSAQQALATITEDTLKETIKFRDYKQSGVKGISECKIRSVILPLLADHVLREANHYIRLLKQNSPTRYTWRL